MKIVTDRLVIN